MVTMLIEELYSILRESYDIDTSNIDEMTKIREYLDSLDYLGFLIDVKKKYHLHLSTDEYPTLQTLKDVKLFIEKSKMYNERQ